MSKSAKVELIVCEVISRSPVRLEPDLLEKAREVAKRENRTLTNLVETLLRKSVDGGGDTGNGASEN